MIGKTAAADLGHLESGGEFPGDIHHQDLNGMAATLADLGDLEEVPLLSAIREKIGQAEGQFHGSSVTLSATGRQRSCPSCPSNCITAATTAEGRNAQAALPIPVTCLAQAR